MEYTDKLVKEARMSITFGVKVPSLYDEGEFEEIPTPKPSDLLVEIVGQKKSIFKNKICKEC